MTTYRTGDCLDHEAQGEQIIAHVVNDIGRFGAGFSGALARPYPIARRSFLDWPRHHADGCAPPYAVGRVLLWPVADRIRVAHLCAQRGVRGPKNPVPLDLAGLGRCLTSLAEGLDIVGWRGDIVMPRVGTGLAGGEWRDVEPLLVALARWPVYVYALEAT